MPTTRIKICGITNLQDAVTAARCGADYLGFNFFRRSPRYIEPAAVRRILEDLRRQGIEIKGVGVFVDEPVDAMRAALEESTLAIAQMHGHESPQTVAAMEGYERIKAIKVTGEAFAEELARYEAEAFLADAPHPTMAGGSGLTYDYALVAEAARQYRIFLAGGLTPANVAQAIEAAHPYAVDVASGVESSPGLKDAMLVEKFCKAVRNLPNS